MKKLRSLWEQCRVAKDNLDKEYLEHGTFHGDVCNCTDCKPCHTFNSLPSIQQAFAILLWGQP